MLLSKIQLPLYIKVDQKALTNFQLDRMYLYSNILTQECTEILLEKKIVKLIFAISSYL